MKVRNTFTILRRFWTPLGPFENFMSPIYFSKSPFFLKMRAYTNLLKIAPIFTSIRLLKTQKSNIFSTFLKITKMSFSTFWKMLKYQLVFTVDPYPFIHFLVTFATFPFLQLDTFFKLLVNSWFSPQKHPIFKILFSLHAPDLCEN